MMYNRHPRRFFDDVDAELLRFQPFLPTIEVKMLGWPQWTPPRDLKLKILAAAATGAEGILIWPGLSSLSGLDLALIRECSDALTVVGDDYAKGTRNDGGFVVQPAEKGYPYGGHRGHERNGARLLTLFNFHSARSALFNVAVRGETDGGFIVSDPVRDKVYRAPSGAIRWSASDLRTGFALDLPAAEVAWLRVEPVDAATDLPAAASAPLRAPTAPFSDCVPLHLKIPSVKCAPVLDGVLNESAWGAAAVAQDFVMQETLADPRTVVRVLHDDVHLYVAFECFEPHLDELSAVHLERDTTVWADDCAELFWGGSGEEFYHIIVNPKGALYDARGLAQGASFREDTTWNPDLRVATGATADAWTVEMAVPLAELGVDAPSPGAEFGVNFCSSRVAGYRGLKYDKNKQASSWVPVFGSFVPPKFGKLVLGP